MTKIKEKQNIPERWSEGILGYFLVIEKGKMPKKTFDEHAEDRVPYLSIKHLDGFEHKYAHVSDGVLASKSDLLVIADGSGSGRMYKGYSGLVSSTFLRITSHSPEIISNDYLESIFQHLDFTNARFRKGGAIPHFDFKQLKDVQIQIPPLKEQQKIAEILGAVDEDIAKTSEVIATTEKLKRGLMQQLFTRGIGHTKFKQTDVGEVPEEWEVVTLKESTKFIDYRGKTPKKTDAGIPLITAKNIRQGYVCAEPREYISEKDYDTWMTRGIPKKGDVLFTTEAPLGYVAQIDTDEKIALAQRTITIQSDQFEHTFLKYLLLSPEIQKAIQALGTGGTVRGIKASTLKTLKVPKPTKAEQQEIADILSSIDEKSTVNKKLLAKLTDLKKGLMQDLLSGKVRVNI